MWCWSVYLSNRIDSLEAECKALEYFSEQALAPLCPEGVTWGPSQSVLPSPLI